MSRKGPALSYLMDFCCEEPLDNVRKNAAIVEEEGECSSIFDAFLMRAFIKLVAPLYPQSETEKEIESEMGR